MNFSASLVLRYGPAPQAEYELPQQPVTVGREAINEIVLNDPEVSRRHARISFQNGAYVIEDLGSTNGTFVNGQRIDRPTVLLPGNVVDFGESLSFSFQQAEPGEATMIEQPLDQVDTPMVPEYGRSYGQPAQRAQPAPQGPPPPVYNVPQPAAQAPPAVAQPYAAMPDAADSGQRSNRRLIIGCGCLVFLAVFACAATVFLLDVYAPDTLYCGPLQPIFEAVGLSLACS